MIDDLDKVRLVVQDQKSVQSVPLNIRLVIGAIFVVGVLLVMLPSMG